MKKWRCSVCGYVHEGEAAPAVCPICGVGSDEFIEIVPESKKTAAKRWKCTVCDYVHTGDEPPESCPLCGVSKDNFVLLEDTATVITSQAIAEATEGTARSALDKVSYGLYVLTSVKDNNMNGQCVNTVFQLTDKPLRIAICLNKNNLTHDYVAASGVFAVSILGQDDFDKVRVFGYQSGRNVDKFAGVNYVRGQNQCPILADSVAYVEARVLPDKTIDVGTHTLFVADVTAGRMAADIEPLTYAYYRANKTRTKE